MAIKTHRIVVICSVVYLAALTCLAAYALHTAHKYSLPIPDIIPAFAVALPPLAGIALEAVMSLNARLARKGQIQASRVFQLTVAFFLVFETMLATLAGTHISPPGSLTCHLNEKWQELFSSKDGGALRTIQDAYNCCGFNSVKDRAFPFKDATRGDDACQVAFKRTESCFGPWREEERKVAIMLLVVPLAVFVWKVAIITVPSSNSSWLPSHIRLPGESGSDAGAGADETTDRQRTRRAIGYRDLDEAGEDDSLRREVTNLNKDSQLATHVEGNRAGASRLFNEANEWRESRDVGV